MKESKLQSQPSFQDPVQPVLDLLQGGNAEVISKTYGITREELETRFQTYLSSRRQSIIAEQLGGRKAGRNEPCPCGSGKKFKKCCLPKQEEARKNLSQNQLRELEERTRAGEKLEEDIKRGFDLLFMGDFSKTQASARRLLSSYPEDDRLHDLLVTSFLATGEYDNAFASCRQRWQVALDERDFYRENGYHKREGGDRKQPVHFYSPSTWLEKFWIAQRARVYREMFPGQEDSPLKAIVMELKVANDIQRFPSRQEDGYQVRKQALA